MMKDLRNPSFAALAAREGGQCYFCGPTKNRLEHNRADYPAVEAFLPLVSQHYISKVTEE